LHDPALARLLPIDSIDILAQVFSQRLGDSISRQHF